MTPSSSKGLCLTGCHVVAQTQGYHLVCIWASLVKFHGGGIVVKFDVFLQRYAFVCAVCRMQAIIHSVANDPSQQAVKLVVVGPGFFEQFCFGLYLGDQWH